MLSNVRENRITRPHMHAHTHAHTHRRHANLDIFDIFRLQNVDFHHNLICDNFDPELNNNTKNKTYDNIKAPSQFRKISELSVLEFKKLFTNDKVFTKNFYNTAFININEAYGSFGNTFTGALRLFFQESQKT